jgi:hypothetical protein
LLSPAVWDMIWNTGLWRCCFIYDAKLRKLDGIALKRPCHSEHREESSLICICTTYN